jgi:hypothetical protein
MHQAIAMFLASCGLLFAAEPVPNPAAVEVQPAVKELDAERLQIGEVIFNRKTREIRFPARVNFTGEELLEFAVVHSTGKIHEALLVTDISATDLNVAFKLLRYQASPELYRELEKDGRETNRFPEVAADIKAAARIEIGVEWEQDGQPHTAKINEWISHGTTGKAMDAEPWVYGGSFSHAGKYAPDVNGEIIAIYLSRVAMINFSGDDNNSDDVWMPFPKRVPAQGTKVTVTIAPYLQPKVKP